MRLPFSKYQGTGNDFIIIDNRLIRWQPTTAQVKHLCDRHFGIGADGLMLLSEMDGYDFAMTYYNSDGNESTMCGNGGRCMTAFARSIGLAGCMAHFRAADGDHYSEIFDNKSACVYRLQMKDTRIGQIFDDGIFVDTGSPHFVVFVEEVLKTDVLNKGRQLRNDPRFFPGGTNVDFVETTQKGLFVRTYERGVETETLSCGTGVTAAAIAHASRQEAGPGFFRVSTQGGELTVNFKRSGPQFTDVWLEGPARLVFVGETEV